MNKRFAIMVLVLAATTSLAGIIDTIVFRDNSFAKCLNATARLMTLAEAVDEIAQSKIMSKAAAPTNTSAIIYLTIQNTNNLTVWGRGCIRGRPILVNEPFSFAVGAHQTHRMMIIIDVWPNVSLGLIVPNEDERLTIEWEEIFKK